MSHRDRYREHRPQSSLSERRLGRSPTDQSTIELYVEEARRAGVIVFLRGDLERMPWGSAEIIRSEHKRLHRGR